MEKTKNILITSVGRRVSLVRSFQDEVRKLKLNVKVFSTDYNPELSSACQISDKYFKVKKVTNKDYMPELLSICKNNEISLVIPTIDTELLVLAENREEFEKHGITILVSSLDFVKKCRDKRKIHMFFDSVHFRRAEEYDINDLEFPLFVKPYDGSRSVGAKAILSEKELTKEMLYNKKNMFLECLSPNDYTEFTIDIYFNRNSKIIAVVPRERIAVRDGEVNKACSRKNNIIDYVKKTFGSLVGLKGCITLQVFRHNKNHQIVGIEVNPRFGGGYPLTYLTGANYSKWIIEEYILEKEKNEYFQDWEENLLMLRYDHEILVYEYKG